MSKLWFVNKRYGWGWTPSTWEGWLVTGIAIGLITANSMLIEEKPDMVEAGMIRVIVVNVIVVAALLIIAWKKGEKPRWRWGN
jgi:tetrahydromethanopterin S-methyltransferase subunit E